MSRFDESLEFILAREGGYVNDPNDHGGATNYGITQTTYNDWLTCRQLPLDSVQDITMEDVKEIYKDNYWVDGLPIGVDLLVFDSAVQHGKRRAIKWLQELVRASTDGVMGNKSYYQVNQFLLQVGKKKLMDLYLDRRQKFYDAIITSDPTQEKYRNGWQNRMDLLKKELYGM